MPQIQPNIIIKHKQPHTAARTPNHCWAPCRTLPHCRTRCRTAALPHTTATLPCTAAHCHAYCHTAVQYRAQSCTLPRCRTLQRALPHTAACTAELPHTASLPHIHRRTAAHCRTRCRAHCHTLPLCSLHTAAHCRTVPYNTHSAALPDSRTLPCALLHTVACTAAHCCCEHCHTPQLALSHTATLPHTVAHCSTCGFLLRLPITIGKSFSFSFSFDARLFSRKFHGILGDFAQSLGIFWDLIPTILYEISSRVGLITLCMIINSRLT
jgi:hypothetical protein